MDGVQAARRWRRLAAGAARASSASPRERRGDGDGLGAPEASHHLRGRCTRGAPDRWRRDDGIEERASTGEQRGRRHARNNNARETTGRRHQRKKQKTNRHARANAGTLYEPEAKKISYIPLGAGAPDFAFVALDTGTDRPGLEKSTYKIRREECDAFAEELFAKSFINRPVLADVKDFGKIRDAYTRQSGRRTWSASRTS